MLVRAFAIAVALLGCAPPAHPGPGSPVAPGGANADPPPARVETIAEPAGREPAVEAVPAGDDLVRGRATARVDASLAKVREVVQRYGDYAEFMPFYKASRVIGKDERATKVYMQVAALHGLVKMGARLSLPNQPQERGGWDVYESHFDGGNVNDFKAIWRMKAIDQDHTFLSLEVFLLPKLPLPVSVLNHENEKGARNGVNAMRDRIEGRAPAPAD